MIIAATESKGSWRLAEYPEYKAGRSAMPEDLRIQIPYLKEIFGHLGIPLYSVEGYEADDVIATLAVKSEFDEVLIASGDKDLLQVVNDRIKILDTMKGKIIGREGVIEKFGVEPSQVADYLALVGDSSDNVPGAKGIGPKGAVELITEHKNIEALLRANLPEKMKTKIDASRENIILSKRLVVLKTDLDVMYESNTTGLDNREELNAIFSSLSIKSLIKKF